MSVKREFELVNGRVRLHSVMNHDETRLIDLEEAIRICEHIKTGITNMEAELSAIKEAENIFARKPLPSEQKWVKTFISVFSIPVYNQLRNEQALKNKISTKEGIEAELKVYKEDWTYWSTIYPKLLEAKKLKETEKK